jgi:hypothetical protein
MNLERKAHSSIIIKHRCQNNLQHPQDPRNQNLNDDNANKPHKKKKTPPKKQINTNKQKRNLDTILCYTKFGKFGRTRTHRGVRTESKKISANRNQRGRSKKKTNQKKRTNVADTRKIEGKKTACNAQKGAEKDEREREREKEERDIRTFLFPSKSSYIHPPHPSAREGARQKRDAVVHLIAFSHP